MRPPAPCFRSLPICFGAIGTLIPTLLFAFSLSVAPQVHERIHGDASSPAHQCAVTMFAAGNCDPAACDQIFVDGKLLPSAAAFQPQRLSIFVAPVGMSILEHAPPAKA